LRRFFAFILVSLFLFGCSSEHRELDHVLNLRNRVRTGNGCLFDIAITADYGTYTHSFELSCKSDAYGNIEFVVTQPNTIAGIKGKLMQTGGEFRFDDKVLAFPMLADGYISPVCVPWVFMKMLEGGYIRGAGQDGDFTLAYIDDSYRGEPMEMELWLCEDSAPVRCEILWNGKRILSADVKNFTLL